MNHIPATIIRPEQASAFFEQVEGLQMDHVRATQRSRRVAWWVAAAFAGVAVLEGVTMACLGPIHTVEWRLVRVDSATGVVDEITQLREAPKNVDAANDRFYLAQYVRMREGYAAPEAEYNFRAVTLMSTHDEQTRYAADFNGSNPQSPQVVFGKSGFIRIHIESVSVLSSGLGQVRFTREEQKDMSSSPKITHWVATIGFAWHPNALMSNADRTINPLGFQVSDMHIDAVVP